jgi:predicted metal-binding transcription factor (methanogenesis marker protein 9)
MEFTNEFILELLELQKTEPNKFDALVNSFTDKQHIAFSEALKAFVAEIPAEFYNATLKQNLAVLDKNMASLEEKVIGDEINNMMGDIELEALAKERRIAYMGLKNELRKKLLENPSSPETKLLINHIIKTEKDNKYYNEAEWADVLPLLASNELPIATKPIVEATPPFEATEKSEKSPYSRPPLTRNQIFLKLDKLKFKPDELSRFMSTKGMTREEYCIAVPMLFSMYEGTREYKTNKQFREEIIQQKKEMYEIVEGYTEHFKKQKEEQEALETAKEKAMQAAQELTDKLKDQLMLEPNNEDIKKVIRELIENEKKYKVYNEEYWEDILHLL